MLKPQVYWIGIILSLLIITVGPFPLVFHTVGNPSKVLISYVIKDDIVGGLFSWLYWEKGLEVAFLAHIFSYGAMLLPECIFYVF